MRLQDYFSEAVKKKASDIHLVVGLPPTVRVEGNLSPLQKGTVSQKEMEALVYGSIDSTKRKILEKEKELDYSYEVKGQSRFRVNVHWEKDNLSLVARIINERIPSLEELSMPQIVTDLTRMKQGLIMVTGPTGCGKSTTLASMVELINTERSENIITLEDPIEFVFTPKKSIIRQRQLHSDMKSFPEGLKHVLRQDPDVIMVGEMRDLETIATTITLAETGHLVLATLHTYSAAQTVDRIIDIFPPHQQNQVRMQLSLTLKSVISQRLIIGTEGRRIATREVLINTPAISNLIRENKIAQIRTAIQTGADEGMITMDQDLKDLAKQNKISKEIALANMINPETF
jgi:twitching motility protein PilT